MASKRSIEKSKEMVIGKIDLSPWTVAFFTEQEFCSRTMTMINSDET
jgi:hypothetical protein